MITTLNSAAIQASSSSHTQVPCSMPLSSTSQAFPASTFLNLFKPFKPTFSKVLQYNHLRWTLALVKLELIGVQPHPLK